MRYGVAIALLFSFIFAVAISSRNATLFIDDFSSGSASDGLPAGWEPLAFRRIHTGTTYRLDEEEQAVKAVSMGGASAIFKKVDINLKDFPILHWRWKVSNTLQAGDARSKEGDDYAARVYVTFSYKPHKATFFDKLKYKALKTVYRAEPPGTALNYIWANKLPVGEAVANSYTERAMMVAIRSGPDDVGQWFNESRNVYEDYLNLFGQEPPRVIGIALMTDTDNTGESATAWYDDIFFQAGE